MPKKEASGRIEDSFFETKHLTTDLKGRSLRGGTATVLSQLLKFVLQTGTTFLLARLLAPEDFGLIGMVTVLLVFVEFFKNLGLSTATIQKAELSHDQVNTLFWINVALGMVTAGVVASISPWVASFYKEPRLVEVTLAFSGMFLLSGLTVQHKALLQRQMQFSSLAKIEISSMGAGTVAAILSAWLGASYWAIVIWRLVQTLTSLCAVWIACSWRPGLPKWEPEVKSMLAFGGNITGFNLVNYFSRNLDNILIGRYWGAEELGLYSIAYRILLLPIQQINSPVTAVAVPALSRLQNQTEKFKKYYFSGLLIITTFGMPIVGFSFASADVLIPLILGEQWMGAVPIFRLLAPAAFFGTFNVATGWVFTSLGRVDKQLYQGIVTSIINTIVFIICIRWGAIGMAAGFGISRLFVRIPSIIYCYKGTSLHISELTRILCMPGLASIISALLIMLINDQVLPSMDATSVVLINLILYALFYLGVWFVIPNGKNTLKELIDLAQILITKKVGT